MSEYDYQDDSDEDEELRPAITCIKAMPQQRDCVVYGNGYGNLIIYDTRAREGNVMSMYNRSADGGDLVDLTGGFAHKGGLTAVEVLGDGTHIVSGGHDGTVCVWETRTGASLLSEPGHGDAITEITGLGGQAIVTTSLDCKVKVWDCRTLAVNSFSHVHSKGVLCAARLRTSAPEEKIVLTGSKDDAPESLACWSGHAGASEDRVFGHVHGHTGPVTSLASVGIRTLVSGGGLACRRVKLWEFDLVYGEGKESGQVRWGPTSVFDLGTHRGSVTACCAVGGYDAACSAGSDGSLRIWRLQSRVLAAILQDNQEVRTATSASLPPLTPQQTGESVSSKRVVIGGGSGGGGGEAGSSGGPQQEERSDLRTTGGLVAAEGIVSVCSTVDGSCLVSGSTGGQLRVWDVETKHVLAETFLKHEGGDTYQRMTNAVRRSLPGMKGGKVGGRSKRAPFSFGMESGGEEPMSPWTAFGEKPSSWGEGVGDVSHDREPGKSNEKAATSPAKRGPTAPLGSLPWQNTMQVQQDVIQRPPSTLPAELHAGKRYGQHARPTTGSLVSSGSGTPFAETGRSLALPRNLGR